ncbi:SDR family oxidoreductase [Photobacterium halotolerans]|uniref:Acetoacetyl-CoA reductase n=1 Tax=Photobacterium halotolerans TaxID=265726 RepID=A0A7X4WUM3_9GAMM|nr:SDR family oxidoreductase [Photobacterium halotolerans]NAW65307.1 acetoacetyl-CoA reductase [Photobacterium halotolerans]NAW88823.1 acetoacetyl-CoA reductase [Photobacterium halotolerans]NAX46977.1 acetoacetyl-CoA reductase [Photobacterium halotolerans]
MTKVALVTGAKGGIGSAITQGLVDAGYRVIATYFPTGEDKAKEWFAENNYSDSQVRLFPLDVTDAAYCEEALTTLLKEEGKIDVLVNNAGITRDSTFKRMTVQQWKEVMSTNLDSLFNVTHPLFASMCDSGFGRIINISSVNGLKGQFGQANYSAAKAGMIGFTKALAAEGARYGVTVNAIAPGYTGTPMVEAIKPEVLDAIKAEIPMKRLAQPNEISASVNFLASDAAAYITGETLSVNGGLYMH